jgi:hypothetical protein
MANIKPTTQNKQKHYKKEPELIPQHLHNTLNKTNKNED